MKPWMVSITLAALDLQRGGFDRTSASTSTSSIARSRLASPTLMLEGAMEQISMLERLSPQMQESLVREALDGAENRTRRRWDASPRRGKPAISR